MVWFIAMVGISLSFFSSFVFVPVPLHSPICLLFFLFFFFFFLLFLYWMKVYPVAIGKHRAIPGGHLAMRVPCTVTVEGTSANGRIVICVITQQSVGGA